VAVPFVVIVIIEPPVPGTVTEDILFSVHGLAGFGGTAVGYRFMKVRRVSGNRKSELKPLSFLRIGF
jgi:hypothetical protein